MTNPRILIVDDQQDSRWCVRTTVEKAGMQAVEAGDGESALRMIRLHSPDVVLLDVRMPGMDGCEVLRRAKALNNGLPIIMITGFGDTRDAVQMLKAGAYDYLPKPFNNDELILVIRDALNGKHLKRAVRPVTAVLEDKQTLQEKMGQSVRIQALASEVERVASTDFSVLISGETGVGKEIVAQALYAQSRRSTRRFVAVDSGAIPDTLIESELFGHEKGAFTGADRARAGKFEIAAGGTLFLDEVSNLSPAMQARLLRVLQEKRFYYVGGNTAIKVDVRIIAATNRDLASSPGASSFRRDLYYRLAEYIIHVPPLRERREDIGFLAKRFINLTNQELRKNIHEISGAAMDVLMNYDWPGNVRELRNIIRRAVLLANDVLGPQHLGLIRSLEKSFPTIASAQLEEFGKLSFKEMVRQNTMAVEKAIIGRALKHAKGNKAKAARVLRIDYKTIHTKLKRYGISMEGNNHGREES